MIVATILLLSIGRQDSGMEAPWAKGNSVPSYRPAYLPSVLKGKVPFNTYAADSCARGVRPIITLYVVDRPMPDVALSVLSEMTPDAGLKGSTKDFLNRRETATAYKVLSDRIVTVYVMKGRPAIIKHPTYTSREYADKERFSYVQLIERPLPVGPEPHSWAAEASNPPPVPPGFPAKPLSLIRSGYSEWSRSLTPVGGMQYWINWYVHDDYSSLTPKILKELANSKTWKVPQKTFPVSFRVNPQDKSRGLVYMDISDASRTQPMLTAGWTEIQVSWTDSSLLRRRRSGG